MNEQLDDLLGPKPEEVKGTKKMFESMEVGDEIDITYEFKEFPCVDPCYMVVRDQNGNFVIPTNMDFTQIFGPCGFGAHPACPQPSGGTYCGWTDCYGMQVCVTIVHIDGNQYNINFHY
jgi:hypothetical protein